MTDNKRGHAIVVLICRCGRSTTAPLTLAPHGGYELDLDFEENWGWTFGFEDADLGELSPPATVECPLHRSE